MGRASISDDDIVQAMIAFGGSFVKALGKAWQCADSQNQARIKATWPEEWRQYAKVVERWRKIVRTELAH